MESPNPFLSEVREYLEEAPPAEMEVYEDASRSILSKNDSPDLGFTWSLNPYRGCFHACAYCYARPTHEYLGLGSGTDFERKIFVKRRAAELLEASFRKKSWRGDFIVFSGVTDCYQPLEAACKLTRQCLGRHAEILLQAVSVCPARKFNSGMGLPNIYSQLELRDQRSNYIFSINFRF